MAARDVVVAEAAGGAVRGITATDGLGNTTSKTVTFTIHATINGLINSVNDGVGRGYITSPQGVALVSQLQSARKGNSTKQKLQTFVYMAQQASGRSITPSYAALLANWGQDLVNRTP